MANNFNCAVQHVLLYYSFIRTILIHIFIFICSYYGLACVYTFHQIRILPKAYLIHTYR